MCEGCCRDRVIGNLVQAMNIAAQGVVVDRCYRIVVGHRVTPRVFRLAQWGLKNVGSESGHSRRLAD